MSEGVERSQGSKCPVCTYLISELRVGQGLGRVQHAQLLIDHYDACPCSANPLWTEVLAVARDITDSVRA